MLDSLCIGLAIVACIFLIPFITTAFGKILEKIYQYIFGNMGVVAVKNLRGNKHLQNSIVLLAMGIATILMVSIFGRSVVTGLTDFAEQTLNYDLTLVMPRMDRSLILTTRSTKGIKDAYGLNWIQNVKVIGSNERLGQLEGVDTQFPDFKRINGITGDLNQLVKNLNYGRNIVVSNLIKNRLGLKEGDNLSLRLNNKERSYKVIGFVDTMEGEGNYAMIAKRYFKADTGQTYYNELAVKTYEAPAKALKKLFNKFSRSTPSGFTTAEFRAHLLQETDAIFIILDGFSILTALIGLIGLINNLIINFIERKRYLAILRSVGATKKQTIHMILIEAASSGIIGACAGVFTGLLMVAIIPYFTKAMMATIPAKYPLNLFLIVAITGIFITILAAAIPALRTSKLNIVESIKYE
jgi:putative ABC transport system permease protein